MCMGRKWTTNQFSIGTVNFLSTGHKYYSYLPFIGGMVSDFKLT